MDFNIEMIKAAKERIENVARKTPMIYSDTYSNMAGFNVYLKCENKQKTGAFKLRGAYNKIATLSDEEKAKGVIASSAGNHAQGVAYAATSLGIKSTIVMPKTAPRAKVEATLGYGAEVVQYGEVYDECYAKAVELQKETGATFIHPFNDEYVMAGQGTLGLEILEEVPKADVIVVPIGGGGLISGIAMAAKSVKPSIKIIGVQPSIIASTKASLEEGKIVTLPGIKSIADGISVATPGDKTFEIIKKYVDEVITVSEDDIARTMFRLLERTKLLAEGAGASALAAILSKKIEAKGKNVVALISGGNVDVSMMLKVVNRELVLSTRRLKFKVELTDRIGQLGKLVDEIGDLGANIIKISQDNNWDEKGIDFVDITFVVELQTEGQTGPFVRKLKEKGYAVTSSEV